MQAPSASSSPCLAISSRRRVSALLMYRVVLCLVVTRTCHGSHKLVCPLPHLLYNVFEHTKATCLEASAVPARCGGSILHRSWCCNLQVELAPRQQKMAPCRPAWSARSCLLSPLGISATKRSMCLPKRRRVLLAEYCGNLAGPGCVP